jgi:hypothetical protein
MRLIIFAIDFRDAAADAAAISPPDYFADITPPPLLSAFRCRFLRFQPVFIFAFTPPIFFAAITLH